MAQFKKKLFIALLATFWIFNSHAVHAETSAVTIEDCGLQPPNPDNYSPNLDPKKVKNYQISFKRESFSVTETAVLKDETKIEITQNACFHYGYSVSFIAPDAHAIKDHIYWAKKSFTYLRDVQKNLYAAPVLYPNLISLKTEKAIKSNHYNYGDEIPEDETRSAALLVKRNDDRTTAFTLYVVGDF